MGEIQDLIERWWMRWIDFAPGIPYWDPYVASCTLFIAAVLILNVLRLLFVLRGRGKVRGFEFARMAAERDKRLRANRERTHQG